MCNLRRALMASFSYISPGVLYQKKTDTGPSHYIEQSSKVINNKLYSYQKTELMTMINHAARKKRSLDSFNYKNSSVLLETLGEEVPYHHCICHF